MPTKEDIQKIRTHVAFEEAKLDLDLEWENYETIIDYGCEVMDRTKSLEQAFRSVEDLLEAWKKAERDVALYCKQLEEREASQPIREEISMRAAMAARVTAPGLAAKAAQGLNRTKLENAATQVDDQRQVYKERERRLDFLKAQFPNIFHRMEVNDLASPVCIAHLSNDILQSISRNLGQHRVIKFHLVSLAGGTRMMSLPHEVDYFELKLGPEICRDWLEPRADHGFPVARIKESWEAAKRLKLDPRQTHANLAFDIGKVRLVTSPDRQCVITYFEEGYMK